MLLQATGSNALKYMSSLDKQISPQKSKRLTEKDSANVRREALYRLVEDLVDPLSNIQDIVSTNLPSFSVVTDLVSLFDELPDDRVNSRYQPIYLALVAIRKGGYAWYSEEHETLIIADLLFLRPKFIYLGTVPDIKETMKETFLNSS